MLPSYSKKVVSIYKSSFVAVKSSLIYQVPLLHLWTEILPAMSKCKWWWRSNELQNGQKSWEHNNEIQTLRLEMHNFWWVILCCKVLQALWLLYILDRIWVFSCMNCMPLILTKCANISLLTSLTLLNPKRWSTCWNI